MSTDNISVSHYAGTSRAASRNAVSRNLAGYMQSSHSTQPHSGFQWTLRLIALIALAASGYLAWVAMNAGNVAGCGSGDTFDCSQVLSSRWSSLLGVPVSYPAVLLYTLVSALLMIPATWQGAQWRWPLVVLAAFMAGLGGLWFIGLQLFVLQHLCAYCLVVHACGLALAGLIIAHRSTRRYISLPVVGTALIAVLSFVAAQIVLPAAEKFEMVDYESTPAAEVFTAPGAASPVDQPASAVPANDPNGKAAPAHTAPLDVFESPIFESPLQAPKADSSTRVSPLPHSWMLGLHPALLFTAQVAASSPPPKTAPADQPDSQPASQPAQPDDQADSQPSSQPAQPNDQADSQPASQPAPAERKLVSMLNGVQLDVTQWPLLGSPDAKYVIVEMLDYTCGHCQNTHAAVHGAMQHYGDQLAVVVLPVPMDAKCNSQVNSTAAEHREACEIAKLAIAVWHISPQQFTAFHNWLMEAKPRYAQALAHAETLIDRGQLQAELQSSVPADFIKANVKLYQRASAGAIPKILFPRTAAVGEMRSKESLISLIEKQLAH